MLFTTLSTTDIRVSRICLGTMGFGDQVMEPDAHAQMDFALDSGVNFFDTAEMYPIPPNDATYGITEGIIGRWLKKTGNRDRIVLASKVMGPNRYAHVKDRTLRLDRKNIELAIEGSLRRLQTDTIDLYQLHWPDRNVNYFGERSFVHREGAEETPIEETLSVLANIAKTGKVKLFGLSNESPWGTMEFLRIAQEKGLPRMVSVQNVYNLLNRHYEVAMAEVSIRSEIGLLAYSPLAFGMLGGRYFDGALPENGRFTLHPGFAGRYRVPHVEEITKLYADLARKHGMTLPVMSLAFIHRQPFVTSTIIGTSTMGQLKEDIGSIDCTLSPEVLKGIEEIQERYPNPCA